MPDHRNVLFICTDQQQAHAIGAVDDSFDTPNTDQLVDRGTLFTGCHSTHPQCSPARSSLVTGLYPHQTGVHTLSNWGPYKLDPDSPSVGRAFRNAGYDPMWIGRWDLGTDNEWDLGWRTRNLDVTGTGSEETPRRDEVTVAEAVDYLDHCADEPFFLTASFNLPHPPFYTDEQCADRYDPAAMALPESWEDDLADKPAHHRRRAAERTDEMTEDDVRHMRFQYRTMVSRVDDHVGRILDALERNGLRDDTAVLLTADHGDMQAAHRLTRKGAVAYDEILRVPMVVDIPWRQSERDRIPDLCSLDSVPSTLLDAADLPTDAVGGESLLPALERTAPPDDEVVFFEHKHANGEDHPYRGVRTREWKFVENLTADVDELYHLTEDPHEIENVAGTPERADIEASLRERVADWWERSDGDLEEWSRPADRYD